MNLKNVIFSLMLYGFIVISISVFGSGQSATYSVGNYAVGNYAPVTTYQNSGQGDSVPADNVDQTPPVNDIEVTDTPVDDTSAVPDNDTSTEETPAIDITSNPETPTVTATAPENTPGFPVFFTAIILGIVYLVSRKK